MLPEHKGAGMWFLDFPRYDRNTHAEPTLEQFEIEKRAMLQIEALKETLEMLTIPQQRRVTGTVANSIFRYVRPAGATHE